MKRVHILVIPAFMAIIAVPAWSQSAVTVYGFLDAGIYKFSNGAAKLDTIQRSSIGFKGTEDLGGGNSATFNLQTRFNMGTGTLEASGATPFFQGESTVGLKGSWGALRLGRALTPMWAWDWAYDPWYNFDRVASVAWQIYHPSFRSDPYNNGPIGEYARLNNAIFYDSPTFNGFHTHLSVGVERHTTPDANGNVDKKRSLGGSLNFDQGPASAMVSAEQNSAGDRTYFAAGSYVFGNAKLMGTYSQTRLTASSQTFLGDQSAKRSSATVGGTYGLGQTTLKLSYGRDFQGYGASGGTNQLGAGAEYALSKRTSVYVDVGYQMPKKGGNSSRVGTGLSHTF